MQDQEAKRLEKLYREIIRWHLQFFNQKNSVDKVTETITDLCTNTLEDTSPKIRPREK